MSSHGGAHASRRGHAYRTAQARSILLGGVRSGGSCLWRRRSASCWAGRTVVGSRGAVFRLRPVASANTDDGSFEMCGSGENCKGACGGIVVLEDAWAGCCTKWKHDADNAKDAMESRKCAAQPGTSSTLAVDELMVIANYARERAVDVFSVK